MSIPENLAANLLEVWDDAGWADGANITRAEIQMIADLVERLQRERAELSAALEAAKQTIGRAREWWTSGREVPAPIAPKTPPWENDNAG